MILPMRHLVLLSLALALTACGKAVPEGQVLAIVNGDDVTQRDLAAEAPFDRARTRAVLDELIDRRLLANVAREKGIEQTPEYLAAMRRAREQLLVQALGQQLVSDVPPPGTAEIAAYIASHPHAFAERALVELKSANGDERFTLDSARLAPAPARELLARQTGDTFIYAGKPWRVMSRQPSPLVGPDARIYSEQSIRSERLTADLERILKRQRTSSSILYNNQLGPPAR